MSANEKANANANAAAQVNLFSREWWREEMARRERSRVRIVSPDGVFLGWLEPVIRVYKGKEMNPQYFMILPSGVRTEFTLPSRRQGVEWLKGAQA